MHKADDIVPFPVSKGRDNMNLLAEARAGGISIAERRAAKFGFNAEKINTPRFRTASPLASPAMRSPCLTIPSGISPTALLDSPMMLLNNKALPSPTTGSLSYPTYHHQQWPIMDLAGMDGGSRNFEPIRKKYFKEEKPFPNGSTSETKAIEAADQRTVFDQLSLDYELPTEYLEHYTTNYPANESEDVKPGKNVAIDTKPLKTVIPQDVPSYQIEENGTGDATEGNIYEYATSALSRSTEDGYNWRKYGQKQVKGSEYPRSYYKCTNPNCPVKKKVERSLEGHITEIIYKGTHNHAKPHLNRRSTLGSSYAFDETSDTSQGHGSVWAKIQSDGSRDGFEIASSGSIVSELADQPFAANYGKSMGGAESGGTPELSSTMASHDDDEDRDTQGSLTLGEGEESESKRRKKESHMIETTMSSRAVREPRIVVQIESEIDILDDGFRWRKYGQKVVKGNPNPRSYYKCTSAGCGVRKHVERASHDLKCVLTTYEGKHNHEVPAARNGNHINSGGSHAAPVGPGAAPAVPRNHAVCKTEMQISDLAPQFERKHNFGGNDYLHPGLSFGNGGRFGNLPIYPMNFPSMPSVMPYTSFSGQHILPDYALPLPPPGNLRPPGNLSMASLGFNVGKSVAPVQPIQQQNDIRFFRPKQEQSENYDVYSSVSSLAYNRISGGFQ